jgi:hypothetical protein
LGKRREGKSVNLAVSAMRAEANSLEIQIRNSITRHYNNYKKNPEVIKLNAHNYNLLNKTSIGGVKLILAEEAQE